MPFSPSARKPDAPASSRGRVLRFPGAISDQELVTQVLNGCQGARREFVERYSDDVERLLYRILGPDPDIADLMQDVFLAALGSVEKLRGAAALRSWLGGIAVRKARKLIRRRRRWRFIQFMAPAELPQVPSTLEVSDALTTVYAILRKLPADERIVFSLRYLDGRELSEVASLSGVSLATVKRRLARAQRVFIELAGSSRQLSGFVELGEAPR